MKNSRKPSDVCDFVVKPIIEALEKAKEGHKISPWSKPWINDGTSNAIAGIPARNGVSRRSYNGINWLILNMLSNYASPDWFTLNQLKSITGKDYPVPEDEWDNATSVLFWKMIKSKQKTAKGDDKYMPLARTYWVWNRDQIPGLPEPKPDVIPPNFNPETEIDKYLTNLNLRGGVNLGGNRACYIPSQDAICLPLNSAFRNKSERESTKAHEGIHATGAKHRLNRKKAKSWLDGEDYAYEELVAELGAAMTCAHLGIPLEELQHTAYIKSWLKHLKNDSSFIISAAAHANKAFNYLIGEPVSIENESTEPLAYAA